MGDQTQFGCYVGVLVTKPGSWERSTIVLQDTEDLAIAEGGRAALGLDEPTLARFRAEADRLREHHDVEGAAASGLEEAAPHDDWFLEEEFVLRLEELGARAVVTVAATKVDAMTGEVRYLDARAVGPKLPEALERLGEAVTHNACLPPSILAPALAEGERDGEVVVARFRGAVAASRPAGDGGVGLEDIREALRRAGGGAAN